MIPSKGATIRVKPNSADARSTSALARSRSAVAIATSWSETTFRSNNCRVFRKLMSAR